jgi:hypothetical protein
MKLNLRQNGIKSKWIRRGFVKIEGDKIKWLHKPESMVCRATINKLSKHLTCNKGITDQLKDRVKIKNQIDTVKQNGRINTLFMGTDCDNTTWEHQVNIPANVMSFIKLWNDECDNCEGRFHGGRPVPNWVS